MTMRARLIVLTMVAALAAGCATKPVEHARPPPPPTSASAPPVVAEAQRLLGIPYRYGGADPSGFDCSGLVYYVYLKQGIGLPRTSADMYAQMQRVSLAQLHPGDLVFFRLNGKISHVGIYSGGNRFIHAVSEGKAVSYASLDDPYWRQRLVGAGRVPCSSQVC